MKSICDDISQPIQPGCWVSDVSEDQPNTTEFTTVVKHDARRIEAGVPCNVGPGDLHALFVTIPDSKKGKC